MRFSSDLAHFGMQSAQKFKEKKIDKARGASLSMTRLPALSSSILLIVSIISVKEESDPTGVGGLPFPDTDFKPEDIKLDGHCDFGNGM